MAVASGTPATRELRLLYFVGVDPEALGDPPRSKIRFRRCDLPAKRSGLPCRDEGAHLPAFAFGAGIGDVVDGWAWAPNVVAFATNVRTMGFSEGNGPRGGFQTPRTAIRTVEERVLFPKELRPNNALE